MCDSLSQIAWLNKMTDAEYEQCRFPAKGTEDKDLISSDFRDQYANSPLTGAGFKITPIGMPIPGSAEEIATIKNRLLHGRIAGYLVELNPPACIIGHNRELVNGVPQAAMCGVWLLKHWLATNGCTEIGLDAISPNNVTLHSATPTFLFVRESEDAARILLAEYRSRSETLCNAKIKKAEQRKPAYSIPAKAGARETKYIYTAYIRQREYLIDAYVKVAGVSKAFHTPITDGSVEFSVQRRSERTLRIGTKVHAKWLRDNGLDRIAGWIGNSDAYKKAFDLTRENLRLDEPLRSKQLRKTSIASLNLSQLDKTLLQYHIKGGIVREHPRFQRIAAHAANQAYSASRLRVYERVQIDFNIPYDAQKKNLHPKLSDLLVFPGEYEPEEHVAPHVFSRVSVPKAITRLEAMVADLLRCGKERVSRQDQGINSGTSKISKLACGRSISNVHVDPNIEE